MRIPIRVQLPDSVRRDIDQLSALKVPTGSGGAVPLGTVADISLGRGPTSIDRYDRSVRIAVEADTRGTDALGDLLAKATALVTHIYTILLFFCTLLGRY